MELIRRLSLHYADVMPNGMFLVGSDEAHYRGSGNYAQKVNIVLRDLGCVTKQDRLTTVSLLVGREIRKSTKELTVAEAQAIWAARDMLKRQLGAV